MWRILSQMLHSVCVRTRACVRACVHACEMTDQRLRHAFFLSFICAISSWGHSCATIVSSGLTSLLLFLVKVSC